MVDFVVSPTRSWNRITPADGDLINPEIVRIYNNLNHLKDAQENPNLGFQQLNNTPSSFTGKVGQLPVVNQAENGLTYQRVFGLLDSKWSSRKFSPSPEEPWFRKDLDHTFDIANWPLLVPALRNTKWEIGAASVFNVTGFTTGSVTRLQLEDTLTARNLLRALLEDYHFSKSYVASTNADGTDSDTEFSAWGFIVRITSDIGTGTNAPKVGQEFRIRYLTSLANTLSVSNRYICIDKDSSSLATTGSGTIEIYPFRIATAGTPNTNSARWRKTGEAGLMTPGAIFYSGTDLVEVPPNCRVRDRGQGHWHELYKNATLTANGGDRSMFDTVNSISLATDAVRSPVTDTANGTPRTGPGTRGRQAVEYLYGNGVIYLI